MTEFEIVPDQLHSTGRDLDRPECVLCTKRGDIYTADRRGGVMHIFPDGRQELMTARQATGDDVKPNGIAMMPDGAFLLADLGRRGGVWRLARDGTLTAFLTEVEGERLPPTNFVPVDGKARVWITVSTRAEPRSLAYRPDVADGFMVLADDGGARVVADGLGYTNEVRLDADGSHLYVNETFGRRLSRYRVGADGTLTGRETVAEFGEGTFPDGLAFDVEGGLWVTSVVSNRLIRIGPGGGQRVVIEDSDAEHVAEVEKAFQAGRMGRPHLDQVRSRRLKNMSSLAFGGPDLKTAYLGCLLGSELAAFRSPVAGLPPVHWEW